MNKIEIKSLVTDSKYQGILMIKSIEPKIAKNNKTYYRFLLTDGIADLEGSFFNEIDNYKSLSGKITNVSLKTQIYNGKFGCIVESINPTEEISDEVKGSFIKYSSNPEHYKKCLKELKDLIAKIQDKEIKNLCEYTFLQKYHKEFITFPGGKTNHHTGFGGLLEHSLNLALQALCISDLYSYDYELNKDLLVAGALFQDIGKIYEYEVDELYNTKITKFLALKGHVAISNEILYVSLSDLKIDSEQDKFCHLSHIILSHHSLLEYGATVQPCTPEAILISKLDKLDSEMKSAFSAIHSTKDSEEFTPRLMALQNTSVLMPKTNIYKSTTRVDEKEINVLHVETVENKNSEEAQLF